MAQFPETRVSLILRLAQPADVQAWQEFADIYTPALLALARRKGLQAADAEDLTQEILFGVARSVQRFEPDPTRARFRTWLWRIARNRIADHLSGQRKTPCTGAVSDSWLDEVHSAEHTSVEQEQQDALLEADLRASLFRLAARRIRGRVAEPTWQAFQLTAIENIAAADAAEQIGIPLGSVYVARCRVMKLLRAEVETLSSAEIACVANSDSHLGVGELNLATPSPDQEDSA